MKFNLGFRDGKGEGRMMMMHLWPIGWFYRHVIGLYLYLRPAAYTLYDIFGTTQSAARS